MNSRAIIRLLRHALTHGETLDLASGDTLVLQPATDDQGALHIGDGSKDMDVKAFLGATSKYVLLDVGNSRIQLEDVDVLLGDDDHIDFGDGNDVRIKWNGNYLEAGPASGLWAGAPSPADPQYHSIAHEFFDDFLNPASATASDVHAYTSTDDGGTGTNAFQDAAGGVYNVVTAGADNDYHAMSTVNETWLFASGKKLWFEARFKLTEANTNESAWWFGFTDTLTTGGFQANDSGPLASYDGALIWKDEGTMAIDFETSNAGSQATASDEATFASATWTKVGFYFDGSGSITPYYDVDGTGWVQGTAKDITLSGLEEMHLVYGVKAGPTGGAETLEVDYLKVVQLR